MIIELLIEDTVFTVIETTTPELEFETYQVMFPNITSWREYQPTTEEITQTVKDTRAKLYRELVDPLTAQINRLIDMAPESLEIEELKNKRAAQVAQIRADNPYLEVQNV